MKSLAHVMCRQWSGMELKNPNSDPSVLTRFLLFMQPLFSGIERKENTDPVRANREFLPPSGSTEEKYNTQC